MLNGNFHKTMHDQMYVRLNTHILKMAFTVTR